MVISVIINIILIWRPVAASRVTINWTIMPAAVAFIVIKRLVVITWLMILTPIVRQSTEYAYTYFWMSLRGHKKISSKYSLYIELWLYFTDVAQHAKTNGHI